MPQRRSWALPLSFCCSPSRCSPLLGRSLSGKPGSIYSSFASSSAAITIYLWKRDRALLSRRINAGPIAERSRTQQIIQLFASLGFLAILVVPSLDYRFSWSLVPLWLVLAGDLLVALGFYIVFRVFCVNTFTAATVEVTEQQTVISTGPYAFVRHPMYSGASIMLLGTPLALASWLGVGSLRPHGRRHRDSASV